MNTTCEQISFIRDEQKQDTRKNTLRLRERLLTEHGFETFDDKEILTAVLSYAKGSRDTAGLVNRLFDAFGSLKAILEARPEQLLSVDGMTLSRASMISLVVPLTRVWHRCAMTVPDRISNTREAESYCMSLLAGERLENFYVIALNARCSVLGHRRISTGSLSEVSAYARVSTDHDEQFTSYEAQIDYYTRFIQAREDWEFVQVYTDEGITGTSTKRREGFRQMMARRSELDPRHKANSRSSVYRR